MTNNINPLTAPIIDLARIAADTYFADDFRDADTIAAYIADCNADNLHDALSTDIADLLSNSNECDLFPFIDDLNDADFNAFSERFDNDYTFDDLIDYLTLIALDATPRP